MYDIIECRRLIDEYGRLWRLEGYTAQSRGQHFNRLIAETLRCWGINAVASFRASGEIDVGFALSETRYVLEAKWTKAKTDSGHIAKLQKRVRQRMAGTYGVFLSMSGYSTSAIAEVAAGERLEILLLDATHFEAILSGLASPQELLSLVHDHASFYGEAYVPLPRLLGVSGSPPEVNFGAFGSPSEFTDKGALGLRSDVILDGIHSRQIGITVYRRDRLLLTMDQGVVNVDLASQSVQWAVPLRDCHGKAVYTSGGAVLFTRRNGVGSFRGGRITIVAGGLSDKTSLLPCPDGSIWVLDKGSSNSHVAASITKVGKYLRDEEHHTVTPPTKYISNALWLSEIELLTHSNGVYSITSMSSGARQRRSAPQSDPLGVVNLGNGFILTSGGTELNVTDLRTGAYSQIAKFMFECTLKEFDSHAPASVYTAFEYEARHNHTFFAIARIQLPYKQEEPPVTTLKRIHDELAAALRRAKWPVEASKSPLFGEWQLFPGPMMVVISSHDQPDMPNADLDAYNGPPFGFQFLPKFTATAPIEGDSPAVELYWEGALPPDDAVAQLDNALRKCRAETILLIDNIDCSVCGDPYPEGQLISATDSEMVVCPACVFDDDAMSCIATGHLAHQIDRLLAGDLRAPAGWSAVVAVLTCAIGPQLARYLRDDWETHNSDDLFPAFRPYRHWSSSDEVWIWLPPMPERHPCFAHLGVGASLTAIVQAVDQAHPHLKDRLRTRLRDWEKEVFDENHSPDRYVACLWPAIVAYVVAFATQAAERRRHRPPWHVVHSFEALSEHLEVLQGDIDPHVVFGALTDGVPIVAEALGWPIDE